MNKDMLNTTKIFFLVFVLMAKFTLSFFGDDFGVEKFKLESLQSSKNHSTHSDALCYIDESDSRFESDDDDDDSSKVNYVDLTNENVIMSVSTSQCVALAYSAQSKSYDRLFILFRNFRL